MSNSIFSQNKVTADEICYIVNDANFKLNSMPSAFEWINNAHTTYTRNNYPHEGVCYMVDSIKLRNLNNLDNMLQLKKNWNGYDADPIPHNLIYRMKDIINDIKHQPDVFPTACDSIQFEFEKDSGEYLEFNLSGEGITVFTIDKDQNENTFKIPDDINEINKVVTAFYDCYSA